MCLAQLITWWNGNLLCISQWWKLTEVKQHQNKYQWSPCPLVRYKSFKINSEIRTVNRVKCSRWWVVVQKGASDFARSIDKNIRRLISRKLTNDQIQLLRILNIGWVWLWSSQVRLKCQDSYLKIQLLKKTLFRPWCQHSKYLSKIIARLRTLLMSTICTEQLTLLRHQGP